MKNVVLEKVCVTLNVIIKINMNCLILCVFILFAIIAFCMKRKYIHPVDDGKYAILAKFIKGSFVKSFTERSKKDNGTAVQFWRVKEGFEIKGGVLR